MDLNADFSQTVAVDTETLEWTPSPMAGVDRRPLDRIGDEVARATTIVRYAAGSHFSAHIHAGGEEFIVLDGVFQDEHGDYPVGTYVRNPPQSSHTPGSEPGCTIFVKLWQFDPADRTHVRIAMEDAPRQADPTRPGVDTAVLFENLEEKVRFEVWEPGTEATWTPEGGAELFVLSGSVAAGDTQLTTRGWLRVPVESAVSLKAGPDGARIWIKSGHLSHIRVPDAA